MPRRPFTSNQTVIRASIFLIVFLAIGLMVLGKLPEKVEGAQAPEDHVTRAWQLALESGSYTFETVIDQTSYPVVSLISAGVEPIKDKLAIQGEVDLPTHELMLTLWMDGSFDPDRGTTVRIEGDKAYGRNGQGEWEEIDNLGNIFAPGGDPMAFLAGIDNVALGEFRELALGQSEAQPVLQLTQYTFDMNGPVFAEHLRQQLEKMLQENGTLPPGLQLSSAEIYNTMNGQGEFWVDANGLPARLILNLDFPAQEERGRMETIIVSDFSQYDLATLGLAPVTFSQNPVLWAAGHLPDQTITRQIGINAIVLLVVVSFLVMTLPYWKSRRFYAAVVMTVITTMLVSPLLRGQQVEAFYKEQQARFEAQEARVAEQEALEEAKDLTAPEWNPHQDAAANYQAHDKALTTNRPATNINNLPSIQTTQTITSTDSDGDGLNDADEALWLSCAFAGAPQNCEGVSDPTDSDGDGLSDGLEVNGIGILPSKADSDNDSIIDSLEVQGFSYSGQVWYLNPLQADTNRDGRPDGLECAVWSQVESGFDPAAVCPDTDGDGVPDVFDIDNDGDGVQDQYDLSPDTTSSSAFDDDNPFSFSINNLETDKPVIVDFQLRPTNPEHLSYQTRVLDWPGNDNAGQIQRVMTTTFATTDNTDIRSSVYNANYGDIRLVPLLEITMPYQDGHYANLPVLDSSPANRAAGTAVDDWLDTTELEPYGISVRDIDSSSTDLVTYVPVTLEGGSQNEGLQAFRSRMIYYPEQGTGGTVDWGNAHQVRLIWMIQMITDRCTDEEADPATCDRSDTLEIVHIYEEEWELTGMAVSEEHGFKAAVIYEDPSVDNDRQLDDELWMVSWNLNNNFLRGRDCPTVTSNVCSSDGSRDVTIDNLSQQIDNWSSGSNHIEVETFTYSHQGYSTLIGMQDIPNILNNTFTPYAADTNPTLLVARELNNRQFNADMLGTAVSSDLTISFNTDDTAQMTMAGMSWAPYQYKNGSWKNFPLENYLTLLADRFSVNAVLFPLDTPQEEQSHYLNWAQTYYATVFYGFDGIVEFDGQLTWSELSEELDKQPFVLPDWGPLRGGQIQVYDSYKAMLVFGMAQLKSTWSAFDKWEKFFKYSRKHTVALDELSDARIATAMEINDYLVGASFLLLTSGVFLMISGAFFENDTMITVGRLLVITGSVVMEFTQLFMIAAQVYAVYRAGGTLTHSLKVVGAANKTSNVMMGVTFVLGLSLIWGIVGMSVLQGDVGTGSVEFMMVLASATAASIVFIIFFIFTNLPLIGPFIAAVLGLTDLILFLLGKKGITDHVTEWVTSLLYDIDYVIKNIDSPDRITLGIEEMNYQDPEAGLTVGNTVSFTFQVTNTIQFHQSSPESDARKATFVYQANSEQVDIHEDLEHGSMKDDWQSLNGRHLAISALVPFPTDIPLSQLGSGLNRSMDGYIYLTEGFVQPYEGCWLAFGFESDCKLSYMKGSSHLNLGAALIYDILPDTIEQFVGLKWNNTNTLPFPIQTDYDGDGLLSQNSGGADPDDTDYDTDGDGLTDRFELTIGTDPENPDSDSDGLTDEEERRFRTNPLNHDPDGDGLTDYIEVKLGWLAGYGTNSNGQTLVTRVWSDPNSADADQDTLNDLQEYIFGGNPWVPTDPSIIETTITFDEITVTEPEAPVALYRFEEPSDSTVFEDSSGFGLTASCNVAANQCPTMTNQGYFGSAADFIGDRVVFLNAGNPDNIDISASDFSIGAWVNIDQGGSLWSYSDNDGSWEPDEITMQVFGQTLNVFTFGSSNVSTATGLTLNDGWHHVMFVWDFDGSDGAGSGRFYVDGADVTTSDAFAISASEGPDASLHVGTNPLNATYFDGLIDEFVAFDRALTAEEVSKVMNGFYYPDDGIVAPGTELAYQAVVTNTSPAQPADGFLTAQAFYDEPPIATPEIALSFDSDDYLTNYTPSSGVTPVCLSDGACPKFVPGIRGAAPSFDGVNDRMQVPRLGDEENQTILSMWLNVSELPTNEGRTYILYTPTGSFKLGPLQIYLEPDGMMNFRVASTRAEFFDCHVSTCSDITNPSLGLGHPSNFFTDPANLNGWHHFLFEFRLQGGYSNLAIDGVLESTVEYGWNVSDINGLILAPGWLGNGQDSYSGNFFKGMIDEMIVYRANTNAGLGATLGDQSVIDNIYSGNYYFDGLYPELLIGLDRPNPTAVFNTVDNLLSGLCPHTTACPQITADGKYGSGLSFDGGDHLSLGERDFATGDYTIGGWFKTSAAGEQAFFNATDRDNHSLPGVMIGTSNAGVLRFLHRFPTEGSGGSDIYGSQVVNDGQWHYFTAVRQGSNLTLYLDGQVAGTGTSSEENDEALYTVLGYFNRFDYRQFNGQLDEIVMLHTAVNAEEVLYLMNSAWPAIDFEDEVVTFNAPAQTTVIASGSAQVSESVPSGWQQIDEQVNAVLQLVANVNVPIVGNNANALNAYLPFELEAPGDTVFDDITDLSDFACYNNESGRCPTIAYEGAFGQSAYFDGIDDSIHATSEQDMGESFAFWVNVLDASNGGYILDTRGLDGVNQLGMAITVGFGRGGYGAGYNDNTIPKQYIDLPVDEWVHIAVVGRGDPIIYINGEARGRIYTLGVLNSNVDYTGPVTLGSQHDGTRPFQGYIDDFRSYDINLTAADVLSLYQDSGPRMNLKFDEESDASYFQDSGPFHYIGRPSSTLSCAELTIDSLTINTLPTSPTHLRLSLDNEALWESADVATGALTPAISAQLCGVQSLQISDVTGGTTLNLNLNVNTNSSSYTFSGSGLSVTVNWTKGDINTLPDPTPGTDGKIGNTARINGPPILVSPEDDSALDLDVFTIMLWVAPDGRRSVWQNLISKHGNGGQERNYQLVIPPGTLNVNFGAQRSDCATWISGVSSNGELLANQWNHVALSFNGSSASLYINGVLDNSRSFGSNVDLCENDHAIRIGGGFQGELDELALYGRSLTAQEIFNGYLRELRWYSDAGSTRIQIDADPPVIELLTPFSYRPNGYTQLSVKASDPSSRVPIVMMGIQSPGDTGFTWQSVPLCEDRSLWCPYFDTSSLGGSGQYQVQFRAVDVAGNESYSGIHQILVDDTAPVVSSGYNGDWLPLNEVPDVEKSWMVSLTGSIEDPLVGGLAGSGIVTETAVIRLIGPNDEILNGAAQHLTINGNTWSVDYLVSVRRPSSLHSIEITVEDRVGNSSTTTVGTIRLDKRPSSADIYNHQLENKGVITQTMMITGTVSEQPDWGGAAAVYHFEETAGAATFYDARGQGNDGNCDSDAGTCPQAGVAGVFGSGLQFDGLDDTVDLTAMFDPITETFSLALWFNVASGPTGQRILVQQGNGSGQGRTLLYLTGSNRLASNLGGSNQGPAPISADTWYHTVLTYDGTTVRFYLDGQPNGSAEVTAEAADGILNLGSNRGGSAFFGGFMDEVTVFNRVLTEWEITALSQMDGYGVEEVEIGLLPVDFSTTISVTNIPDRLQNVNWQAASVANPNTPFSDWSYTIPDGQEEFYELYVRSRDGLDNESNPELVWRGAVDSIAPRVTFTITHLGQGKTSETEYAFTFEDLVLDPASFVHPCSAGDLEIQSYGADSALGDQIFQVSAICRVDGHMQEETVTACDMSGLCTDVTASPVDGTGSTPPGEPPGAAIIGETGGVTLDGTIDEGISAQITYQGVYTEPVVVAFLATFNEPEPVDVRVRNVTGSGFELFMEEAGGDLIHASESVNYIVMESGRYTLDGGLVVEAGKYDTATVHVGGMAPGGDNVAFSASFANNPALLYTLNTYNNGDFMSATANGVTTDSFNIAQEAAETGMTAVNETIGWIAFSVGSGTTSDYNYLINRGSDRGGDGVTDTPHTINYSFNEVPVVVVKSNSGSGHDGHWARGAGTYDTTTLTVYAEEDQVGDSEQSHSNEAFSWAAFDPGTVFYKADSDTNPLSGAAIGDSSTSGFATVVIILIFLVLFLLGAFLLGRRGSRELPASRTNWGLCFRLRL